MLTLIRAGLYTSVQDAGRFGMRQSGVSYCGALDRPALEIANVLVGNPGSTAALEITLGQCVIEFGEETWFALTGAACDAELDGKAVWTGWRLRAKAGQRLTLKRPVHGVRSYLAVAGGLMCQKCWVHPVPIRKPALAVMKGACCVTAIVWRLNPQRATSRRPRGKTAVMDQPDPCLTGAGISGVR